MWTLIATIIMLFVLVGPFFENPRSINRRRTKLRLGLPRVNEEDRPQRH